jgi:hypothetical protein
VWYVLCVTFVSKFIPALPADNKVALAEHGCMELLVAAMRNHGQDSELQTNALYAMRNLAMNGTWYCLTPAVAACVEHVV